MQHRFLAQVFAVSALCIVLVSCGRSANGERLQPLHAAYDEPDADEQNIGEKEGRGQFHRRSAPSLTRTGGLRFRKPSLYPPELWGRFRKCWVAASGIPVNASQREEGVDLGAAQLLPAVQGEKLDDEEIGPDGSARLPDQLSGRRRGASRGQEIVHD